MDKFGKMHMQHSTKNGIGLRTDLSISDEALDLKRRRIQNIGKPRELADAVDKEYVDSISFTSNTYVDRKASLWQAEVENMNRIIKGIQQTIQKIYEHDKKYLKLQDWEGLFKEEIKKEKQHLLQALRDIIIRKKTKTPAHKSTDEKILNEAELFELFEIWQDK